MFSFSPPQSTLIGKRADLVPPHLNRDLRFEFQRRTTSPGGVPKRSRRSAHTFPTVALLVALLGGGCLGELGGPDEGQRQSQSNIGFARAFVQQTYRYYLGREAESSGLDSWSSALIASSPAAVRDGILNSDEARARLPDEAYVSYLYRRYLGREPETAGLLYWVGQLPGMGRGGVRDGILASDEAATRISRSTFVAEAYRQLLGREFEDWEASGWVNSGWARHEIRDQFLASAELATHNLDSMSAERREALFDFNGLPGAASAPAPTAATTFVKHGNNGTVSCNEFCQNTLAYWGPLGSCCGATLGGTEVGCNHVPGFLGSAELTCTCAADAFVKPGNNGTVSCDQFCQNTLAYWGEAGTCLSAKDCATGQARSCQDAPGLLPSGLTCTCQRPGDACASGAATKAKSVPGAVRIFLAPNGNGTNTGLTQDQPVGNLDQVKTRVLQQLKMGHHVEVLIAGGTYYNQVLHFDASDAAQIWRSNTSLTLRPLSGNSMPVFDGRQNAQGQQHRGYFLTVPAPLGRPTHVNVYGLKIQHYAEGGIRFSGSPDGSDSGWSGGNTVDGCVFLYLGTKLAVQPPPQPKPPDSPPEVLIGLAGVALVNSRNNTVTNCVFGNLKNQDGETGKIHAVYLQHHAHNNTISKCRFDSITGDPIRVRDFSNNNHIINNSGGDAVNGKQRGFFNAGASAFGSDWYGAGECPSWQNTFKNNNTQSLFGNGVGPDWVLKQGLTIPNGCDDKSTRYCTDSGCH